MIWFDWVVVTLWVIGALTTIGTVNRPKKPTKPGDAVIGVLFILTLIVTMLITHGAFAV